MVSVLIFLFILILILIVGLTISVNFPLVGFFIICVVGFLIILVKVTDWQDKRREKKIGYRVEFVSENILRGEPNQFAVVYYQGETVKWFYGERKDSEYILDLSFPYADKSDDRILMQQRMISELKRKYRGRIKITT